MQTKGQKYSHTTKHYFQLFFDNLPGKSIGRQAGKSKGIHVIKAEYRISDAVS